MSYQIQPDGKYHIPIINLGERLRDNFGLTIREHSHFDPVDPVHSPNSYHYYDEAIDVQDWRDDNINGVDWRTRTSNLENILRGSGAEIIGPGSGVAGHDSHLHLAAKDGIFKLNQQQYETLFGGGAGGKNATFGGFSAPIDSQDIAAKPVASVAIDSPEESAGEDVIQRSEAKERAQNYATMSKAELDSAYDTMRSTDAGKARIEGMKMHKARFGKI